MLFFLWYQVGTSLLDSQKDSYLFKLILFRCHHCGKGTRCHFCSWLVVYCKRDLPGDNEYEVPYKLPYIEMWEDVIEGINAGSYTSDDLEEIFGSDKHTIFV